MNFPSMDARPGCRGRNAVFDAAALMRWPSDLRRGRACAVEHELAGVRTPRAAIVQPVSARDVDGILLRVAAVNAERVQLHQLARVVLVDAGRDVLPDWSICQASLCALAARASTFYASSRLANFAKRVGAARVVDRTASRGSSPSPRRLAEMTQHVRADRLALVLSEIDPRLSLAGEDVEVVERNRSSLLRAGAATGRTIFCAVSSAMTERIPPFRPSLRAGLAGFAPGPRLAARSRRTSSPLASPRPLAGCARFRATSSSAWYSRQAAPGRRRPASSGPPLRLNPRAQPHA